MFRLAQMVLVSPRCGAACDRHSGTGLPYFPRAKALIPILLLSWLGFIANASAQAQPTCVPETDPATPVDTVCTTTRDVDVYFGTLSVVGAPSPDQDFVEFSDFISDGFRQFLQADPLVDPRVQSAEPLFVTPGLGNVEFVLGAPDNFPAQQNLLDDYTAAAAALDALFGPGALTVSSAVLGHMPTYLGEQFFNPPTVQNDFNARFSLFEQNAVYTVAAPPVSTLDHFLGYKTRPPQGSQCGQDAPKRKGKACEIEEECGGYEDDDRDLETGCCVPKGFPRDRQVALADRFETKRFDFKKPLSLYNPADKNSEGIHDRETHLRSYRIKPSHTHPPQPKHLKHKLKVENQFGELLVTTITPKRLLVPTAKSLTGPVGPPDPAAHDLDHFKCYKVKVSKDAPGFPKGLQAVAVDQFNQPKRYDIQKPKQLCVAVNKNGEGLKNPDAGLMCYRIKPAKHEPKHVKLRGIHINNQLGPERFDTVKDDELCVPSEITDLGIVTH